MIKKGQVIKAVSSRYSVLYDEKVYFCSVRGKIKRDFDVYVGDYVTLSEIKGNSGVIEEVFPRKNCLIRPYISNIDKLFILVAPTPQPDWLLVDKMILNCYIEGIEPILCVNKCDIMTAEEREKFISPYKEEIACVCISAETGENLEVLSEYLKDSLVTLAGQSAVGKTSLLNALSGLELKIGGVSRNLRGRNTTRHIEIFSLLNGRIADTCGFSMLELPEIKADDLCFYYEYFLETSGRCRFHGCKHLSEPDCAVRQAIDNGVLSRLRYDNYVAIYKQLKEKEGY